MCRQASIVGAGNYKMHKLEKIIATGFDAEKTRIMHVRFSVFVEEQGVPEELEQDDKDPTCLHALMLVEDEPVATGRMEDDGHIGRIAVMKTYRGTGAGSRILDFMEKKAREKGLHRLYLGAQLQAIPFYEKHGYQCYGNIFMDAGIPHCHMEKSIE